METRDAIPREFLRTKLEAVGMLSTIPSIPSERGVRDTVERPRLTVTVTFVIVAGEAGQRRLIRS